MSKICKNCKAWKLDAPVSVDDERAIELAIGDCRRRAPRNVKENLAVIWPQTYGSDWCLEFVERRDDLEPNTTKHISEVIPRHVTELIDEIKTNFDEPDFP